MKRKEYYSLVNDWNDFLNEISNKEKKLIIESYNKLEKELDLIVESFIDDLLLIEENNDYSLKRSFIISEKSIFTKLSGNKDNASGDLEDEDAYETPIPAMLSKLLCTAIIAVKLSSLAMGGHGAVVQDSNKNFENMQKTVIEQVKETAKSGDYGDPEDIDRALNLAEKYGIETLFDKLPAQDQNEVAEEAQKKVVEKLKNKIKKSKKKRIVKKLEKNLEKVKKKTSAEILAAIQAKNPNKISKQEMDEDNFMKGAAAEVKIHTGEESGAVSKLHDVGHFNVKNINQKLFQLKKNGREVYKAIEAHDAKLAKELKSASPGKHGYNNFFTQFDNLSNADKIVAINAAKALAALGSKLSPIEGKKATQEINNIRSVASSGKMTGDWAEIKYNNDDVNNVINVLNGLNDDISVKTYDTKHIDNFVSQKMKSENFGKIFVKALDIFCTDAKLLKKLGDKVTREIKIEHPYKNEIERENTEYNKKGKGEHPWDYQMK